MGCKTSKLDRLPAVALCRDRCKFLDLALSQSYAFADAHVAHMESLKTLASALQSFLNQIQEKIEVIETKPPPPSHHSHSSSFTSDSDSDDDDAQVLLHSELEEAQQDDKEFQIFTRTVSSSTRRDDVDFTNHVETRYALFSPNRGGYYDSNPPPPPPPPPPPSSSAWDFLNLFEPYERYDETPLYIESGGSYTDVAEKKKEKGKGKVIIISEDTEKVKEVDSREEKLVSDKEPLLKSEECSSSNSVKVESKKGLSEVVKEIQILFERASDSGNPIMEMLDAGKFRYHSKYAFNQGNPGIVPHSNCVLKYRDWELRP